MHAWACGAYPLSSSFVKTTHRHHHRRRRRGGWSLALNPSAAASPKGHKVQPSRGVVAWRPPPCTLHHNTQPSCRACRTGSRASGAAPRAAAAAAAAAAVRPG
eukprot:CAMPEP_0118861678 /NCGR_PEP_ID=MMETSP1163-20130328/7130_1 /TAXON_ID=124430 /ORGANISM="Phaeomonas parva, Strain CCMP2877" /LENGTH=102 /DNA_ID=CAMNT_0006795511 /DNA_START=11 /DNA_END=315 /DNA_ORIENTATION=-